MIFFDRRGRTDGDLSGRAEGQTKYCAHAKAGRRVGLTALSGALLLFVSACQDPVKQAESYALQAQALADAGDNKGALEAIEQAVALRDDNATYFLLLGSFQLRANDAGAAFNAFRRALELDAANVTALTYVANLGLQVGQIDEAEKAADRLLVLNPRSLVGLQVKGLSALFRDKAGEADAYATKMLALSPSDEAGTIIRARTLVKAGQPQQAIDEIDRVMLVSGRTPALLITKLNTYRVLRQPEQMIATYAELLPALGEQNAALKLDQINLLYKMGRTKEAREAAYGLLETGSTDPADYRTLVRIWSEYDPAPLDRETIKRARRWVDPLAVMAVGRYLLWTGHHQVVSNLYFEARPGIRPLFSALRARSQLGINRRDLGKSVLDMILDRDPDDVDAQIMLAQFEAEAGRTGQAIEAAQKAINSDPDDPEAYIVLAGINRRAGDNWRARQIFEDGLRQLPQSFMLIENYTRFLHDLKDKGRAVSAAKTFARALPSSVKAWGIYKAQCQWANDAGCLAEAEKGELDARTNYRLDDPPGTPKNRGLLSQF